MKWFVLAIAFVFTVGLAQAATAADDPTGTWKWSVMGRAGATPREVSAKLKLEGGKLTGTIPGRNNAETAIEDATFKDGDIAFTVTRMMGTNKIVTKYSGKLSGDSIKGKIESDRNGTPTSVDWDAKRSKE